MNIQVVDAEGRTLAQGRDLGQLRSQLGVAASVEVSDSQQDQWNRKDIVAWDFDELPPQVTIKRNSIEIAAYPTVLDQGASVSLRLLNSDILSRRKSRAGIRRLYAIKHRKALRSQVNWLPQFNEVCLLASPIIDHETLAQQVADLITDQAFFRPREKLPRDRDSFALRSQESAERIGSATQDVAKLLPKIFKAYQQSRLALEQQSIDRWKYATVDAEQQLHALLPTDFLLATPWPWLNELPRFLKGIAYRMERLASGSLDRDRNATTEISHYWQQFLQRETELHQAGQVSEPLETFRWMLEEYRVSCFAQPLGTSITISPQRLDKQWAKCS